MKKYDIDFMKICLIIGLIGVAVFGVIVGIYVIHFFNNINCNMSYIIRIFTIVFLIIGMAFLGSLILLFFKDTDYQPFIFLLLVILGSYVLVEFFK